MTDFFQSTPVLAHKNISPFTVAQDLQRLVHYLGCFPPSQMEKVEQLSSSGCTQIARQPFAQLILHLSKHLHPTHHVRLVQQNTLLQHTPLLQTTQTKLTSLHKQKEKLLQQIQHQQLETQTIQTAINETQTLLFDAQAKVDDTIHKREHNKGCTAGAIRLWSQEVHTVTENLKGAADSLSHLSKDTGAQQSTFYPLQHYEHDISNGCGGDIQHTCQDVTQSMKDSVEHLQHSTTNSQSCIAALQTVLQQHKRKLQSIISGVDLRGRADCVVKQLEHKTGFHSSEYSQLLDVEQLDDKVELTSLPTALQKLTKYHIQLWIDTCRLQQEREVMQCKNKALIQQVKTYINGQNVYSSHSTTPTHGVDILQTMRQWQGFKVVVIEQSTRQHVLQESLQTIRHCAQTYLQKQKKLETVHAVVLDRSKVKDQLQQHAQHNITAAASFYSDIQSIYWHYHDLIQHTQERQPAFIQSLTKDLPNILLHTLTMFLQVDALREAPCEPMSHCIHGLFNAMTGSGGKSGGGRNENSLLLLLVYHDKSQPPVSTTADSSTTTPTPTMTIPSMDSNTTGNVTMSNVLSCDQSCLCASLSTRIAMYLCSMEWIALQSEKVVLHVLRNHQRNIANTTLPTTALKTDLTMHSLLDRNFTKLNLKYDGALQLLQDLEIKFNRTPFENQATSTHFATNDIMDLPSAPSGDEILFPGGLYDKAMLQAAKTTWHTQPASSVDTNLHVGPYALPEWVKHYKSLSQQLTNTML